MVVATAVAMSVSVRARPTAAPKAPAAASMADSGKLPDEARATYGRILAGGPFPYRKDGIVFGNREQVLPVKPRGYYREYTVRTPFVRDRGVRRVVCGGAAPKRPDACYFTSDHYSTFFRIEK